MHPEKKPKLACVQCHYQNLSQKLDFYLDLCLPTILSTSIGLIKIHSDQLRLALITGSVSKLFTAAQKSDFNYKNLK